MTPIRYILDTGSADGVIISRTEPDDARVRLLSEHGMPFATHGRTAMGIDHPFHDYDNDTFAYEAVRRLVRRGRRRIAVLQPPSKLTYFRHTREGFERALRDFGAEEAPFTVVNTDTSLQELQIATHALMSKPGQPDGVISLSSSATLALVAGIEAAGHRIGDTVDLVSKQPSDILPWIRPEIIAANEDFRLAGRELAKALLDRIADRETERLQTISAPIFSGQ